MSHFVIFILPCLFRGGLDKIAAIEQHGQKSVTDDFGEDDRVYDVEDVTTFSFTQDQWSVIAFWEDRIDDQVWRGCSASDAVMFSFMLQYNIIICQSHFGVAILQHEPTTSIQEQGRIEPILSMAPEEAKSQPLVMVNVYTRGVLSGKSQDVTRCWKSLEQITRSDKSRFLVAPAWGKSRVGYQMRQGNQGNRRSWCCIGLRWCSPAVKGDAHNIVVPVVPHKAVAEVSE